MIVYEWVNFTLPQDDFPGGSPTKYGVYENADLSCDISPTGLTGTQIGGLRWEIASGGGTLSNITNNGTALYKAHTSAVSVTLKAKVQSGPSKGKYINSIRTIVEPDSGVCVKRWGTYIWHIQNTFSIGLNSYMYLRPKDVSFTWLQFTEGLCNSQTTGWFNIEFINFWHTAWGFWEGVGDGDSTDGCKILQPNGDFAALMDVTPPFYSTGTFLWSIPWSYKAGTYTNNFVDMNQEFKVNSAGKAEVQKDSSGWWYNYHSWGNQSY